MLKSISHNSATLKIIKWMISVLSIDGRGMWTFALEIELHSIDFSCLVLTLPSGILWVGWDMVWTKRRFWGMWIPEERMSWVGNWQCRGWSDDDHHHRGVGSRQNHRHWAYSFFNYIPRRVITFCYASDLVQPKLFLLHLLRVCSGCSKSLFGIAVTLWEPDTTISIVARERERHTRCDSMVFHIGKSSFALYDNNDPLAWQTVLLGLSSVGYSFMKMPLFLPFGGLPIYYNPLASQLMNLWLLWMIDPSLLVVPKEQAYCSKVASRCCTWWRSLWHHVGTQGAQILNCQNQTFSTPSRT